MPFALNEATGQWGWQGEGPDDKAPVLATPTAVEESRQLSQAKPEKVKPDKPWWEVVGGALRDQIPGARYNPLLGGSLDNLANDVQYEVNQLTNLETVGPRIQSYALDMNTPGGGAYSPQILKDTSKLGIVKSAGNASKAVLDVTRPELVPSADEAVDDFYRANGFTPPSEMTDEELAGDDMRASFMLNAMLAAGTMGGSAWLQGTALATKFPFLAKALQLVDPTKAKTLLGGATRFTASQVVDELPSTFLDDNTGGSAVQLLGLLGQGELAQQLDPVKPGMGITESSMAAFLPNLGASVLAGGSLMGLGAGLSATRRALRSRSARTARETARNQLQADGVIQTDEAGRTAFTEETVQPQDWATAEEEFVTEVGLREAPAEETAPATASLKGELPEPLSPDIDPWSMEYDPTIVEADALHETLEGFVSDAGLDEIATRGQTENVAAVADEVAAREVQGADSVEPQRFEDVSAPSDSIYSNASISERFTGVSTNELRSLASSENSPELFAAVSELTGKDFNEFNRMDVLQGIRELEASTGNTVMPSRMMGAETVPVGEIKVDPDRFQFKMGTDAEGQQKGNSLTGVNVWNEDMEGSIQVWTDPMNGETYVVNGHNRLAKAKTLGVPSMKVERINAPTAEAARAKGALTNIAQGGGTPFDAAKFMRDYAGGMDAADLESMGVPLKSGLATEGLALSKLPDNIFQDAVDGRLSKGKALALGGSGLDETGMQQAYKALQSRDMTDGTFNEVLQQARSAPTMQGDQVDLFGNTEMLNLMVQKGELAARIRKDLMADKNLMKRTAKNARRLTEVGNEIDKAGTATLADDTAALLAEFDSTKYMEGPTSQLLNEGAEQIANGARLNVVADRIRRQLIEAGESTPLPAKAGQEVAEPVPLVLTRSQKEAEIVKLAARKGEARPPSTPLPDSPEIGDIDISGDRADVGLLKTLDNEARIAAEFEAIDKAMAADKLEAERASIGYDRMTFDEKKAHGIIDGLAESDRVDIPEAAGRPITAKNEGRVQGMSETLLKWANAGLPPEKALIRTAREAQDLVRAKGQLLDTSKIPDLDVGQALKDYQMGMTTPATEALSDAYRQFYGVSKAPQVEQFTMPKDLAKSSPRFGMAKLVFQDDLDRAAYMLRNKAKKSKGEDRLIAALEEQGYDIAEVRRLGDDIKTQIQDGIEEATGSRRAPQESMEIEVPRSEGAPSISASRSAPQLSRTDKPYDEAEFREMWKRRKDAQAYEQEALLLDIGNKLPSDVARMTQRSEMLAREMVTGLKEAARISGLDPLRIQYLDKIDTRKMFGTEDSNQSLEAWDPDAARFARENPRDPLVEDLDGTTGGVFVPKTHGSTHRHMIYLALGPSLDTRFSSRAMRPDGQMPMWKVHYHEAFHAVQDWINMMESAPGVKADAKRMNNVLWSEDALREMTQIIKKDRFGNYQPGMAETEIQAEAFAVWRNNRKIRMEAGGLQKKFEQISKFINDLRRRWRRALKKDPTYVDIFELAADGKVADAGNKAIAKLTDYQLESLKGRIDPNMDAMLPGLTDRVQQYLQQKQVEYDALLDKLDAEAYAEGC